MKKIILFFILAMPIWLLAEGSSIVTKGGIGSITLNEEVYNKVNIAPELAVWKFGLGLNIELLFDKNGKIYEEDWDDAEDYVEKISYFRFAQEDDPFYFLLGNIESYTLGNGLIMKDYSNMLLYPDTRKLGGMVGFNVGQVSAEFFSANLVENDILGSRIAYSPLSNLQIGISGAADLDQLNGISDVDGDGYPDVYDDYPEDADYYDKYQKDKSRLRDAYSGSDFDDYFENILNLGDHKKLSDLQGNGLDKEVYEVGVDYSLDIYKGSVLSLQNYGEAAKIVDRGFGFVFPGIRAKFLFVELDVGYKQNEKEFVAHYFDALYDQNRVSVSSTDDSVSIITKKESLKDVAASRGWEGTISSDFYGILDLTVSYSDMRYDNEDLDESEKKSQGIEGVLSLKPGIIPKVSTVYIKYKQDDEPKLFNDWKTENTYVEGKIALALSSTTSVNWLYTERYKDLDGNGKISGKEEIISNVSFGLEMTF